MGSIPIRWQSERNFPARAGNAGPPAGSASCCTVHPRACGERWFCEAPFFGEVAEDLRDAARAIAARLSRGGRKYYSGRGITALAGDPFLLKLEGGRPMRSWTFEELHEEHEKITLGLQYTIAERERLKALFRIICQTLNAENANTVSQIIQGLPNSPAERFQDIFALLLSGGKTEGFFVEFGACDGIFLNNTYLLERDFGWRGILAEPDTFWHDRLQKTRTTRIDKRCVSSVTGSQLTFYQSNQPGHSSPDKSHPYLGSVLDTCIVETVSLLDLLKDHDAPRFIDFLSVDTEGHEMEVFNNFDFYQYRFGFICVEQHEQLAPEHSVQPLLEAAGYKVILPRHEGRPVPMQITGVDKFFVPKDHPWASLTWPRY